MAKKKFYAVKKGKVEGIFETWKECEESVHEVAGAIYKSFSTYEAADAYMKDIDLMEKYLALAENTNTIIAYVDGSYDEISKNYSFGCVIITPKREIIEEYGYDNNKKAIENRNIAGELKGVMFVVNWAIKKGFNKIIIRHDYNGIAFWYDGNWKANSYSALEYIKYMNKTRNKINITFEKVAGHSGDELNDRADKLAKKALTQREGK